MEWVEEQDRRRREDEQHLQTLCNPSNFFTSLAECPRAVLYCYLGAAKLCLKLRESTSLLCIANGVVSGISLTLFRVINEVTVPPVMNTPQANCPANEKNLSSLSI